MAGRGAEASGLARRHVRHRRRDHREVRSFHPENRIRLTWQPAGWDHPTTLQVAVGDRSGRTLLRFHQERLADSAERSAQRAHWEGVMGDVLDDLRAAIGT